MQPIEFDVHVSDEDLSDLRRRLAATRYINAPPGADWRAGIPVEYLRELLTYWQSTFDWRKLGCWRRPSESSFAPFAVGGTMPGSLSRSVPSRDRGLPPTADWPDRRSDQMGARPTRDRAGLIGFRRPAG